MEQNAQDVTVFLAGFISGGALTAVVVIALTKAAVRMIFEKMVRKGFFFYEGDTYRVRQSKGEPTDG